MAPSLIGEDVRVEGNIASKGEIHVDGEVKGDIDCVSLVVGQSAQIEGGVKAEQTEINGSLSGSIDCQRLTLRAGSRVDGEVRYTSLTVEDGAQLEGSLRHGGSSRQAKSSSADAKETDDDEYIADVRKYAASVNGKAVKGIVSYLGKGILSQRDASVVSCSDPAELKRVRDNYCKKKLAIDQSDTEIDAMLKQVCETMKGEQNKSRVTFYYLVAEKADKLRAFS